MSIAELNVFNWDKKEEQTIIDWWKILNKIDDPKLVNICGTDVALYLIWLKYTYKFFGAITFINCFLIILYAHGTPKEETEANKENLPGYTLLNKLTAENISAPSQVICVFFLCIFLVSGMVIYFLFKYMTKFHTKKSKVVNSNMAMQNDEQSKYFVDNIYKRVTTDPTNFGCKRYSEIDVAAHSIMMEGLPKNVPREMLEKNIKSIFQQLIYNPELSREKNESQLLKVSVISDFNKCLSMVKELKLSAGKFKKCV